MSCVTWASLSVFRIWLYFVRTVSNFATHTHHEMIRRIYQEMINAWHCHMTYAVALLISIPVLRMNAGTICIYVCKQLQ